MRSAFKISILCLLTISAVAFIFPLVDNARADALSFLSTPTGEGYVWYKYDYEVIPSNYSATLTLDTTTCTWAQLYLTNWHLIGFPNETNYGRCWMYLKLTDDTHSVWQNFSIDVVSRDAVPPLDYNEENMTLALALIFCFAFLVIGLKQPMFFFLAGMVWIVSAVGVFLDYDEWFMIVGLGVGFVAIIEGGLKLR